MHHYVFVHGGSVVTTFRSQSPNKHTALRIGAWWFGRHHVSSDKRMTFDCQYARHRMSPPRMGGGSGGGGGWGGVGRVGMNQFLTHFLELMRPPLK